LKEKKGATEESIRQTSRYRRFFSYDPEDDEILLLGNPISYEDLKAIQRIRKRHTIPDYAQREMEKYYLESLIWTISNQRINYERALRFMNSLHGLTIEELRNPGLIYKIAKEGELSWMTENKFEPAFSYMKEHGGIKNVVRDFLENPHEMREELSKVKWLHLKSASLWHLALGGKESLLVLDSHNAGQAAALGIKVPEKAYIGYRVQSGKNEGKREKSSLTRTQYLQVEQDLIDLFFYSNIVAKYPTFFINENNNLDGGFLSILLWWTSVQAYRKLNLRQRDLFGMSDNFISPYRKRGGRKDVGLEDIARDAFVNKLTIKEIRTKYALTDWNVENIMKKAVDDGLEIGGIKITQELRDKLIKRSRILPYSKLTPKLIEDIAKDIYISGKSRNEVLSDYNIHKYIFLKAMKKAVDDGLEIGGIKVTQELRDDWVAKARNAHCVKLIKEDQINIARDYYIKKKNPKEINLNYNVIQDSITRIINKSAKEGWVIEGLTITPELRDKRKGEVWSHSRSKVSPQNIKKAAIQGGLMTQELHGKKVQRNLSKARRYGQNIYMIDGINFQSKSEAMLGLLLKKFGVIPEFQDGVNVHRRFIDLQQKLEVVVEKDDTSFPFGANIESEDEDADPNQNYYGDRSIVDFFVDGKIIEFHQTIKKHKKILNGNIEDYTRERESQLRARGFNGQVIVVDKIAGYSIQECLIKLGIEISWDKFLPEYKDAIVRAKEIIETEEKERKKQIEEEAPF
jgi:hypothetical protein